MKIAEINMTAEGSTGGIMFGIAECARKRGHQVRTYSFKTFTRGKRGNYPKREGHAYLGSEQGAMIHFLLGYTFGSNGRHSSFATRKLIRQLRVWKPDVLHLHNLHKFCINLPMLFQYIKKNKVRVVWTFHDCFPFTGKCPHFTMAECDKWKNVCSNCPQLSGYPKSRRDTTKKMWNLKKKWFTGVEDMTIVTPSNWLAGLVKESFLKDYPVRVIPNGIDISIFQPQEQKPLEKYLVLGVADGWGKRKGLDVFEELSEMLPEDYRILLVGIGESQKEGFLGKIQTVGKTRDRQSLAKLYAMADVFVNPTREDNFPTVNMEALACGTPVVTFRTGGAAEMLSESCGAVVDCGDVHSLKQEIIRICMEKPYSVEDCRRQAEKFDEGVRFQEYVDLFES